MGQTIDESSLSSVGRKVLAICRARDWTLAELNERCEWPPRRVYAVLRLDAIKVADALTLAKVLNVSLKSLANDERSAS